VSTWELDDAERRHADAPRSFFIPPAALRRVELKAPQEGDVVTFEPRHVAAFHYADDELGYRQDDSGSLPARMRAQDLRPLRARLGPAGAWMLTDGNWEEFEEQPEAIQDNALGYLTDLWPELAEPFRDGAEGEEWAWDGSAYRREG
jgi:hypothetical protein